MSRSGVMLLAHGTPGCLAEIPEYLTLVRGGRAPSPELVAAITHNYAAIGGRSPLTDLTRAQATALAVELGGGIPVFVGMRNWKPFIAEAAREAQQAGVTTLVAVPLAPQYSTLSVAKYQEALARAVAPEIRVRYVRSWHDQPGLLAAFAEKVAAARAAAPDAAVVFTAHSLPRRVVAAGDPYADEVRATAAGIAARLGLTEFRVAFQSAGRTSEPWLAPTLQEALAELAAAGCRHVLVAPVSFVCDHTEILYDLDIEARAQAAELGLELRRSASLNDSPLFIRALADIVRAQLDHA